MARVNSLRNELSGMVTSVTGTVDPKPSRLILSSGEGDVRVNPQGKALFFARESVLETPPAPARGRDLQIEAAAVEQPLRLLAGFSVANCSVGKGHGGNIRRAASVAP